MMNARWTTTSASSTSASTDVAVEHVALAVLGLAPALRRPGRRGAGPCRRCASTSRWRSSARMKGLPMSPVGPVTATVRRIVRLACGPRGMTGLRSRTPRAARKGARASRRARRSRARSCAATSSGSASSCAAGGRRRTTSAGPSSASITGRRGGGDRSRAAPAAELEAARPPRIDAHRRGPPLGAELLDALVPGGRAQPAAQRVRRRRRQLVVRPRGPPRRRRRSPASIPSGPATPVEPVVAQLPVEGVGAGAAARRVVAGTWRTSRRRRGWREVVVARPADGAVGPGPPVTRSALGPASRLAAQQPDQRVRRRPRRRPSSGSRVPVSRAGPAVPTSAIGERRIGGRAARHVPVVTKRSKTCVEARPEATASRRRPRTRGRPGAGRGPPRR